MYELLKVLHLTSVIVWMGGMIAAAAIPPGSLNNQSVQSLRLLMTIGIVLTWIAGLVLAQQGGWFSSPWLHIKLAIVTILSGFHGVVVARLRGRNYASTQSVFWVTLPWTMLATVFGVVYLVILKPI